MQRWNKQLLVIFCLLSATFLTVAQPNLQVSVSINDGGNAIIVSNVQHILQGSYNARYSIALINEPDSIISVTKATYTLTSPSGNLTQDLTYQLSNGEIVFTDIDGVDLSSTGSVNLSSTISYVKKLKVNGQTQNVTLSSNAQEIIVWGNPSATQNSPLSYNVLNGSTINTMGIDLVGGYENGWTTQWSTGHTSSRIDYVATNTSGVPSEQSVETIVTNRAPDNTTIWFGPETFTYHITTYPSPVVEQSQPATLYMMNGQTQTLSINASGGNPDGWSFIWNVDGATGNTCEYVASNTTNNAESNTVTVQVTNTSPDGNIWFNQSYNYQITTYPSPIVEQSQPTTLYMMHGQTQILTMNALGGNPDGWSYTWNVDDATGNTCEYVASNTTNEVLTNTITVQVTNTSPDGNVWYNQSYNFTIDVYPLANSSPSTATTFENVVNGDYRDLGVDVFGGNPNGWKYEWSDGKTNGINHYQALNETDSLKTDVVTVTVTNTSPDGINEWYRATHTYILYILALPYAEFRGSYTDVLSGDELSLTWATSGGNEAYWKYLWILDGATISTDKVCSIQTHNPNAEGSIALTVNSTASFIPSGTTPSYTNSESYIINVWATPKIIGQSEGNLVSCHGRHEQLSITKQGGYGNGWSYQWYLNDTPINGATDIAYNATMSNNSTQPITVTYRVDAINTLNGQQRFNESRYFTVVIYPAPSGVTTFAQIGEETITACYPGDHIIITAVGNGGYTGGWTYQWENSPAGASATKTVPSAITSSPMPITYYVTATNTYDGAVWFSETVPVTVNVYDRGLVEKIALDSTQFLAGSPITMNSNVSGGYPSGWSYIWAENGTTISGNSQNLTVTATNNTSTYLDKIYTLTAINRIGDNEGSRTTITYNVRIWPAISLPSSFDLSTLKIREGNTISASSAAGNGGYPYGWSYIWTENGNIITTSDPLSFEKVATLSSQGTSKATETFTYSLNIRQMGPNGNLWADKTYTKDVTVYRRPAMPNQLVRKGNGTTHTLIVMTGVDDEQLFGPLDYTYRFGYTDAQGTEHLSSPVEKRYFQMSETDFRNSDNRIWAVAEWKYFDGETVTSGRRYVSGETDDDFDASSFVVNRPNYAPFREIDDSGVSEVNLTNNLMINDGVISCMFDSQINVDLTIYSLQGQITISKCYNGVTEIRESIHQFGLQSGVYLIEVKTDTERCIKKLYIK